jgi:hypothetical protein
VRGFARLAVVAVLAFSAAACEERNQVSAPPAPAATTTPAPSPTPQGESLMVEDPLQYFNSCYFGVTSKPPCPPIVATVTLTGDERTDEPRVERADGITITGLTHKQGCGTVDGVPNICWKYWQVTWKYDYSKVVPVPSSNYYLSIGGWRWGGGMYPEYSHIGEQLDSRTVKVVRIFALPRQPDPVTLV